MKLFLDTETFIETSKGLDISIPLSDNKDSVRAWYCDPVKIEPVMNSFFIGDVNKGGSVNFRNILLNPHGNGTHTECVGHISKEYITINQCLKEFHFNACLITVDPKKIWNEKFNSEDLVIDEKILEAQLSTHFILGKHLALIIRTKENTVAKTKNNYSNSNPPYLTAEAVNLILKSGVVHLVVDVPSVDREVDHGKLEAHHLFWNYPQNPQLHRTITELVYIPDSIVDGNYLLNIQITSLESDASPSKLVLYEIKSNG